MSALKLDSSPKVPMHHIDRNRGRMSLTDIYYTHIIKTNYFLLADNKVFN